MSYAIIRNTKYKRENLKGIYRHNERRNKNYSNTNIDKEKSHLNYSLKSPKYSYEKEFDLMREKYKLKGQIKVVSNITCEYIITSDKEFFETIGEEETKRYFETAYNFVTEYKNLGERYIMSAKVHMDEETPHMHLIFLPVVHTQDKKGNFIDKIACSEFWKEKDSYRRLQDAFFQYMTSHNFQLERGLPKEETGRKHIDLKEYKEITNFDKTKEKLQNIKLELPNIPDIADISKFSMKRDEKILEEIIKPKDDLINELYKDNLSMHQELLRQAKMVEKAEKYEIERDKIIADNKELHKQVDNIKSEYKNKEFDLEWKYKSKIKRLEKENIHLNKVVDKFKETIGKFITWICKKFDMGAEDNLIKDFEKDTKICLDAEKQLKRENREKEFEMEL
ncbi:MAG: plasmid recombination protein [Clostridia bacterium]|nr:plasmid recombination protein [Clostridia bacterium]